MMVLCLCHRDTASACGYDDVPCVSKSPDGVDLNDRFWLRTCNDSPVAPACVFDEYVISQLLLGFGFLFCEERADRLCWVLKSRIIRVYLDLCKYACDVLFDAPVEKLFSELVLDIISDVSLAHGCAYRQREVRMLFSILS